MLIIRDHNACRGVIDGRPSAADRTRKTSHDRQWSAAASRDGGGGVGGGRTLVVRRVVRRCRTPVFCTPLCRSGGHSGVHGETRLAVKCGKNNLFRPTPVFNMEQTK